MTKSMIIGVIKEIPSIRTIDFMGAEVAFIPHKGTYWVSREGIKSATGVDVGPVEDFSHQCPKWYDAPLCRWVEVQGASYEIGKLYSIRSAGLALRTSYIRDTWIAERALSFIATIAVLPCCLISNVTIPQTDGGRLRALLDKHPHWIDVLDLWNKGKTEGQIAIALNLPVTKVRSAVVQLREYGFDVMPKRLRTLL